MSTAFVEGTLAQIYKRRSDDGGCYGGPSYYIDQATGKHWLGILFAVFMILTYMVGFNLVASFNIADAFRVIPAYSQNENLAKWIIGGVLAVLFFVCISGGGKQIAGLQRRLFHYGDSSTLRLHVRDRDPYTLLPSVRESSATAFDVKCISGGLRGLRSCLVSREVFSLTKQVLVQLRVRLVPRVFPIR